MILGILNGKGEGLMKDGKYHDNLKHYWIFDYNQW